MLQKVETLIATHISGVFASAAEGHLFMCRDDFSVLDTKPRAASPLLCVDCVTCLAGQPRWLVYPIMTTRKRETMLLTSVAP